MKKCVMILCMALPVFASAQGVSNGGFFQNILDNLYKEMMPMCKGLIDSARLIGGFGALWYIGFRIWRSMAAGEPVDVFGLLRPFAIGICITIFPSVIDLINGIMQPVVSATLAMKTNANHGIEQYIWHKQGSNVVIEMINPVNWAREILRLVLEFLFEVAALVIDVIRVFYLIVLAIIGPIVFALSIYDGFQHLLTVWLARYINVFLWLPVANIFGSIIAKIQELMVSPANTNMPFVPISTSDWAYMFFLLIGIVGYTTVPSVANYIVNAGGGNSLLQRTSSIASWAGSKALGAARQIFTGSGGGAGGGGSMVSDAFGDSASKMSQGMSESGVSNGYFKDKLSGK